MFDGPLFSRSTFGAEKQLISCRFGKRSTCNQTVMSGRIKAGFVDFVVFSLEIDRVRCVPERSFLVRNWCAPSYQLCWSAGYRPGEPYRGFESHSLRQQVIDIAEKILTAAIRATFPN